tara:strand:- start:3073 stop:3552 length:480 start_codon:yes stop_codon:yes gene_type:complete
MKITRRQLRQIIKETLLREADGGDKPSWNLYDYSTKVWQNLKTTVPGTRIQPKVSEAVRDIYASISGIAMQFAVSSTPDGKMSTGDVDRNIKEIIARLEELRKFSKEAPEKIAVLTGDDAFDTAATANISYKAGTGNVEVDDRITVASIDKKSKDKKED